MVINFKENGFVSAVFRLATVFVSVVFYSNWVYVNSCSMTHSMIKTVQNCTILLYIITNTSERFSAKVLIKFPSKILD